MNMFKNMHITDKESDFRKKESTTREKLFVSLYDLYIKYKTDLPCFTVEFMPEKIHKGEYQSQKLILGQRWQSASPNLRPHLLVVDLNLPYYLTDNLSRNIKSLDFDPYCATDIGKTVGWIKTTVKIPHEGDVNKARCCPQKSQIIATKTVEGYINLFDFQNFPSDPETNSACKPQMRLEGHGKVDGYGLSWNPYHQGTLISGSYDGLICMWDINTGGGARNIVQPNSTFRCHVGYVEDVSWFPFHDRVFSSVGDDGLLVIWDTRVGKGVRAVDLHNGEANSISLSSHNETLLAVGLSNGMVSLLDLRNLEFPTSLIKGHSNSVRQVCFSPLRKELLASCADDGIICIWNLSGDNLHTINNTLRPKFSFTNGHQLFSVNEFAWSPTDPGLVASVGINGNSIWQPAEQYLNNSLKRLNQCIRS